MSRKNLDYSFVHLIIEQFFTYYRIVELKSRVKRIVNLIRYDIYIKFFDSIVIAA